MGYYIEQGDTLFRIPAEKVEQAWAAVKALRGQETIKDSGGRHFSWVDQDFDQLPTFAETMAAWRWDVVMDDAGNVEEIWFHGEKLGDDELLFTALAPFVDEGGFITVRGEDHALWRWEFTGTTLRERYGKVEWV